jgi:hypothetical protein
MRYGPLMSESGHGDWRGQAERRILRQLDRMVATGRVTAHEAGRLRAAGSADDFQAVLGEVRARHAGPALDAAVADGGLSQPEADDLRHRVRDGEHGSELRKRFRRNH